MGGFIKKEDMKQNASDAELRTAATNEIMKINPAAINDTEQFIRLVADKFMDMKLHNFPALCAEVRRAEFLRRKHLNDIGNPEGWSEKRDFKSDYDIPRELYLFMINVVYVNFWAEENERVWRSFMKRIFSGDDPSEILKKVLVHYNGARQREELRT